MSLINVGKCRVRRTMTHKERERQRSINDAHMYTPLPQTLMLSSVSASTTIPTATTTIPTRGRTVVSTSCAAPTTTPTARTTATCPSTTVPTKPRTPCSPSAAFGTLTSRSSTSRHSCSSSQNASSTPPPRSFSSSATCSCSTIVPEEKLRASVNHCNVTVNGRIQRLFDRKRLCL